MSGRLGDIVTELARRTGTAIDDMSDEHERWAVYQPAFERGDCSDLLFDAVAAESVPSVALSIVLQMLGTLPASARPAWIEQLALPDNREYATRRANDIAILQSADVTRLLVDEDVQDSWSDWLQLRLAEFSKESDVLSRLMAKGRTKRIRRYAMERHAAVERGLF
ncbi:hypothetical protein OHB54_01630 [Streptomyces sp. NBC_01007]|nr:hypothetical protein OHB54_01630 [Streptomyces sp. NBC_01007]